MHMFDYDFESNDISHSRSALNFPISSISTHITLNCDQTTADIDFLDVAPKIIIVMELGATMEHLDLNTKIPTATEIDIVIRWVLAHNNKHAIVYLEER